MSQIWEYNGYQFEFDLMNAETADRYDQALVKMEEKEKCIRKSGRLNETIKDTCDMVYDFFDGIFGEGASEKIIGKNYNLRACSEAYFGSFIPFANKQVEEINAYYARMKPEASPGVVPIVVAPAGHAHPNRKQRRNRKKKK